MCRSADGATARIPRAPDGVARTHLVEHGPDFQHPRLVSLLLHIEPSMSHSLPNLLDIRPPAVLLGFLSIHISVLSFPAPPSPFHSLPVSSHSSPPTISLPLSSPLLSLLSLSPSLSFSPDIYFNAPSLPFQSDQAVNANATRAPAPPTQWGGSGLSYHTFVEGR